MPIYEYRCAACGHELEALQKLSDAPLRDCPACHQAELRKRVSAAGFQLKGSGWYVTDFRNSGAKPPAKEAASKPNGGNGSTAGEAKPAESKTADSAPSGGTKPSGESTTTAAAPSKSDS